MSALRKIHFVFKVGVFMLFAANKFREVFVVSAVRFVTINIPVKPKFIQSLLEHTVSN